MHLQQISLILPLFYNSFASRTKIIKKMTFATVNQLK